jgi:putative endonuclease
VSTPASASHLALGAEGEARAARYLESKGYRIVELDLILRRGRTVIFVEVKTRRSLRFGPPELAVNAPKRARLVVGAAAWLREHGRRIDRARFDVIAWQVRGRGGGEDQWHVRHFENAFEANE